MLIKCPECGKEISDKATACPNCGCPVEKYHVSEIEVQKKEDLGQRYRKRVEDEGNDAPHSKLSIISLILSIIGCTYIFGLICAIVDLRRKDENNKHTLSWAAIGISAFWILAMAAMYSNNAKQNNDTSEISDNNIESEIEESIIDEIETDPIDSSPNIVHEESVTIFATDLMNEWEDYIGKWVTVSYQCGGTDDEDKTIQSNYDSNSKHYLRCYVDNYHGFEYGDYLTVTGQVDGEYASYIEIKNAHVDYYGDDSEKDYTDRKIIWEEKQHELAIQERDSFIEKSESVSYDDLRRYPDTYKDKAVTLKLKIKSAKPDGWVFQGDIIAVIPGTDDEIAVYDDREVREPRFMDGDIVTVYAKADGLAKIQIKNGKGLFAKVIDEYEVPSIKVIYTDKDNIETLGIPGD